MDQVHGTSIAAIVHAEEGRLVLPADYNLAVATDHNGAEVRRWQQPGDPFADFIAAVRAGDPQQLSAEIREGHLSAGLGHLANDSYRIGERASVDAILATLAAHPVALDATRRCVAHLVANGIELDDERLTFGRLLAVDPSAEAYVGDADAESLRRGTYRKGFTIPEVDATGPRPR